ncbi:MAG: prepilin-type N-terminal cleavage/methylation domain-containing protein [Terriglobales bacterium]
MLKIKAGQNRNNVSGFSLVEMMITLAISIIVTVISVITLIPLLNQQHVTNAYNTTLAAMRLARDNAVAQRTSYSVTFSSTAAPNTIVVAPVLPTGATNYTGEQSSVTYQLPTDVKFLAQTGLPNTTTTAPDGYYTSALLPVDLGYAADGYTSAVTTVYFCPDGSAQNSQDGTGQCSGSWDGGVVYIAQSGNILSSRAVTLWGGTGRIHGWRLYPKSGGGYQWLRQ